MTIKTKISPDIRFFGVITKEYADGAICANPDCDHTSHDNKMFIHATCHISAGIEAYFEDGWLYIRCAECERPVMATPLLTEQQLEDISF